MTAQHEFGCGCRDCFFVALVTRFDITTRELDRPGPQAATHRACASFSEHYGREPTNDEWQLALLAANFAWSAAEARTVRRIIPAVLLLDMKPPPMG